MSGPVFVIDAQGQPLMPVAEAHARKLLRTGKARRWPHPTWIIIQLTRTVETPIIRPLVLGVAVYHTVAQLFALATGPQATFPLLSLIVDLSHPPAFWRHRARRRSRIRGSSWTSIRALGSVIGTLWPWLPISHIVIIRTTALSTSRPGLMRRLRRYVSVSGIRVIAAARDATAPAEIPRDLYAALVDISANPARYTPIIVAKPIRPSDSTKLTRLSEDGAAETSLSGIAVMLTPPLIGIIDTDSSDDHILLHVPTAADVTGVTWRYVVVPADTPFHRWPLSRTVFLPLVPRSVQASVTLYEDRLAAYLE